MVMKIKKPLPSAAKQQEMALEAAVNQAPNGVGTVDITHPDGSEESHQEAVLVAAPVENPAFVTVSMGLTRNLGNFESLKVLVGVTSRCENTPESIEETYDVLKEWVDTKVSEVSAEVDSQLEAASE